MRKNKWLALLLAGTMVTGNLAMTPAAFGGEAAEENAAEQTAAAEEAAPYEAAVEASEVYEENVAAGYDEYVTAAPSEDTAAGLSEEAASFAEEMELPESEVELAEEYEVVEEVSALAEGSGYVLMNIPYADFYAAETDTSVDAVTSATLNKPRTGGLAGGSYHVDPAGTDISGVIYPVYVEDMTVLADYPEITDESSVTISTTNRGTTSETTYTGSDALFESADYSWYALTETPSHYKELSGSAGSFAFGAVKGSVSKANGVTGSVTYDARHADIEIKLSGTKWIAQGDKVSGILLTTDDGSEYPLRHIANIWRTTEIGWDYDEYDIYGKTITNIRYYTTDAVIDYPVSILVQNSGYVLMNIPYAKFYAAETDTAVDAVSSSTLNKPRTGGLAGGSYHVDPAGTDISGVIYPVYVEDLKVLADYPEITDESSVTITTTNRGTTSETTYTGSDALFESADYSWYKLSEEPSYYKEMSGSDGSFTFGAVVGSVSKYSGVTGDVTYGARHANIEIKLSGTTGIAQGDKVSGVLLTTDDGAEYPLRHIANIWRATEIGWNYDEYDIYGKTITNIRYYTTEAVIDYPVSIEVKYSGYVLMNIPYAKFFAAETEDSVDAVSSATKNKPRTGGLAGGSYHVDPEGTDISGAIYPVYVDDMRVLEGLTEITDESSVTITTTNRGTTSETTYEGSDALFESADYSYYVLSEKPSHYKVLSGSDGDFTFGAVQGSTSRVAGVTGTVTYNARHANIEIALTGTTGISAGDKYAGVIVTTDDGETYAFRHVVNVWRATEIGWNYDDKDIYGKTITNIRYITTDAVIDYPVKIKVESASYVLMNIPYAKFYEAESEDTVDAVTSATLNKPRTGTLAGGSYHVDPAGTDISGVIYPVKIGAPNIAALADYTQITDESSVTITVTNRGQETTTTYEGKDALFESADYSYYILEDVPSYYKELTVTDGAFTFGEVQGSVSTVNGVTGSVTYDARHADVEIKLSGTKGIAQGDAVSGVVVTTDTGVVAGLRHVANIWRAVEIGFGYDENNIYGSTITNIRYITQDAVIDYPVSIKVSKEVVTPIPKGAKKVALDGIPEDEEDAKVTIALIDPESDETTTVLAEEASIVDGMVDLTDYMENDARYAVTVTGTNYKYEESSFYYIAPSVGYMGHLANKGWEKEPAVDGAISGTTGQSRRMEAIMIAALDIYTEGSVEYMSHLQNKGWEKSWTQSGEISGTTGQSRRMEAIRIRLTGEMAEYYDIYYSVHSQNKGWLGWAKNGEPAGTEGMSLRMEAIKIQIVPKGAAAPGKTTGAYMKK